MVKRDFKKEPLTQEEVIGCYWYPVIDDTIGGWSISNVNESVANLDPYEGRFELGSFLTEYEAKHIADIHNLWLQEKMWNTYIENVQYTWYAEIISYWEEHPPLTEDDWFDYSNDHEAS
jgi:hypothetical protein